MTGTSNQNEIDYFQSITNMTNRDEVIRYLRMCDWNLEFALDSFFSNRTENNGTNNQLNLENNFSSQLSEHDSNEDDTNHHQDQLTSSGSLTNTTFSLRNSQYDRNSANMSSRKPFIEHVDEIVAPDATKSTLIFPNLHELNKNTKKLLQYIDENIIGKNSSIRTPWGYRKAIYADYTASGRALIFIEQYILYNVLPYYANTHSENNAFALQTTKFREGSRALIKRCVNATDDDVVIFTGSGSTSAINKLVSVLNLKDKDIQNRTVVFISPFEHHSNILPWKETGIEIVRIPLNKQGHLDQDILKQELDKYHNENQKHIICTFNAASNVTGIRTDVDSISTLVHQYNGWIFWDYAAAAPYIKIDMNPSNEAYKDAVFISTHKFVGGPSTPGLLIAKKTLFTNSVPCGCGGGTVNFVTRTNTEYIKDIETREEGGTPDIIGSIRAGLTFHLKESVGTSIIEAREDELVEKFLKRFRNHEKLFLLGSPDASRLAIFSFLIYVPLFDKYLHHNFVCSLLNDLFGIQIRSGCSCAGPYVLDLLHIDDDKARIYSKFVTEYEKQSDNIPRNMLMKPGFIRFNLSYFIEDNEIDYILNALEFIANEGWKFLSLYTYNIENAIWKPRDISLINQPFQFHSLQRVTYENGILQENVQQETNQLVNSSNLQLILTTSSDDPLDQSKSMLNNIPKYVYDNVDFRTDPQLNIPDEYKDFIWFVTPKQVIRKIVDDFDKNQLNNHTPIPFHPK